MNNTINTSSNLYLITESTGNAGRYIVDELIKKGHRVRALTQSPDHANFPDEVEVVNGDLSNPETIAPALKY